MLLEPAGGDDMGREPAIRAVHAVGLAVEMMAGS
jgi:hypothetical protein